MGSGKSSVGIKLAHCIGFNFADTDQRIESEQGLSIAQIFDQYGEGHFRQLEKAQITKTFGEFQVVVSTGGGAPCYETNMAGMLQNGTVIYLRNRPETLATRLEHEKNHRPLLRGKDLLPLITEGLRIREPVYRQAHMIVDCDNLDINTIAQQIKNSFSSC